MKEISTMNRLRPSCALACAFSALLFLGTGSCRAQTTFTVSLDTSSLISSAGGPFSLDFQFSDGTGTGDGNNTVTLNGFNFGAGAATGAATTSGGASGSLRSGITLTDSSFPSELFQSFTPGNALVFNVSLTGNADAGLNADEFSFAILDSTLKEIPTTGSANAFLIADISSAGVSHQTFAGSGAYAAIGAPSIASPVPELGTRPVFGLGLVAGLLALRFRRRSIAAQAS